MLSLLVSEFISSKQSNNTASRKKQKPQLSHSELLRNEAKRRKEMRESIIKKEQLLMKQNKLEDR